MEVALHQRLLSMAATGITAASDVAALSAGEWAHLLVMARRHRLGPLLHWRLGQRVTADGGAAVVLPKPFCDALALNHQKHARRAEELQAEIARVQRVLREHEIPAVFLKGAFLAFHAYATPALRPMRDLDVLVPESQVADAQQALSASTVRRAGRDPALPQRRIGVAFHSRLTDPAYWRAARSRDPAFNAGTWNRLICSVVSEEEVWYLSPEDQLLHLIIHALYDNPRNCRPLVLSDIAHLVAHSTIDWPLFWQMAEAGRWVSGCWLLLNLTTQYYPAMSFSPPEEAARLQLPADLAATAAVLTMGRMEERINASRELKLQVRYRPLHFVLELFGQGRRLADVH